MLGSNLDQIAFSLNQFFNISRDKLINTQINFRIIFCSSSSSSNRESTAVEGIHVVCWPVYTSTDTCATLTVHSNKSNAFKKHYLLQLLQTVASFDSCSRLKAPYDLTRLCCHPTLFILFQFLSSLFGHHSMHP